MEDEGRGSIGLGEAALGWIRLELGVNCFPGLKIINMHNLFFIHIPTPEKTNWGGRLLS